MPRSRSITSQNLPVENTEGFASLRQDQDCFGKGVLIPEFQRRFEWDEEHYRRLWDDACACASHGDSARHYLGPVVLTRARDQDGRAELVDGQQRFTVLSLIVMALRDVLLRDQSPPSNTKANALSQCLEFVQFFKDGDYHRILHFSHPLDDAAYEEIFRQDPADAVTEPRRNESRLKKAHWYFYDQLLKKQNALSDTEFVEYCHALMHACLHQLDCSPIYVRDEEAAYLVFEHINHQGKRLNQADLLKNLLLRLTPTNRQQCASDWVSFIENTNGIPNVDPVTAAWYLFVAQYSAETTKSSFYRDIRDKITTENEAKRFSTSLVTSSDQVKAWASRGLDARPAHLKDRTKKICPYALLQLFGYKTPYPVLLKAQAKRKDHGDSDYVCEHLADLLVRMLVRNKTICRQKCEDLITAKAMDCLETTKNMTHKRRVVNELKKQLSPLDTDDATVTAELQNMRSKDNSLPKGLLYLEFQANFPGASLHGSDKIDLEHVLPKSIIDQSPLGIGGHAWRDFRVKSDGSEKSLEDWLQTDQDFLQSAALADLVYSIGNLALLTHQANRSIKDSDFATKQPYLSSHSSQNTDGSIVPTTQDIGDNNTEWTEQAIRQRADTLASKILAGIPKAST